nr:PREDICTED: uncharacterized protein LOC109033998 [Bemisia tabaci]
MNHYSKVSTVLVNCSISKNDYCFVKNTPYLCNRCLEYLKNNKLCPIALSNGLDFKEIPKCLSDLSILEERMVSPFIPFMQVRELLPNAINSQLGIKGPTIHVPIDLNNVFQKILPRNFNNLYVILIEFKRCMHHKSNYLFETVRPYKIIEALKYLITTPLYKKHKIEINKEFFEKYVGESIAQIYVAPDEEIIDCISNEFDSLNLNAKYTDNDYDQDELNHLNESPPDQEFLVQDNNSIMVSRAQITLAPGEKTKPVSTNLENLEFLCHPKIYAGHAYELTVKLTYHDQSKSEILRYDRRASEPRKVLYMANKYIESQMHSSVNIACRRRRTEHLTAGKAQDDSYLHNLFTDDKAYAFLQNVRTTPAYLNEKRKDICAMIRQLGEPTFFVTLSAAEKEWNDLIRILHQIQKHKNLTDEELAGLSDADKTLLIQNDLVTTARYFNYKIKTFFSTILLNKAGPFHKHEVLDYFYRTEFQNRGSPHIHCFLWLKGTPKFDSSNPLNNENVIDFVDKFITIKQSDISRYQMHKHTHTCYKSKGKHQLKECRFKYPKPIFDQTTILFPKGKGKKITEDIENSSLIQKALNELNAKDHLNGEPLTLESFLTSKLNGMTYENYVNAIRSSIKSPVIFMRRNSHEISINNYNYDILSLMRSNMDIQFIMDVYSCATYLIGYIAKVNTELSKILRGINDEITKNKKTATKQRLYEIANTFMNYTTIGAQEAVYLLLGLDMCNSSRATVFINTCKPSNRVRLLKPKAQLKNLPPNSTDIYQEDSIAKYANRRQEFKAYCLADYYAKIQDKKRNAGLDENLNLENVDRTKLKVIRFCNFKESVAEEDYYREQIMLFYPWTNEMKDLIDINCKETFHSPQINEIILRNRSKYIFDNGNKKIDNLISVINECNDDGVPENDMVDLNIVESDESTINDQKPIINRRRFPLLQFDDSDSEIFLCLNDEQKRFALQVLHNFRVAPNEQFLYFLSGIAGSGKTHLVKSLIKLVTNYFNYSINTRKDTIKVLVVAPTGKAGFLVGGTTLHHAFGLPVRKHHVNLSELSNDVATSLRGELKDVQLVIIEEVSMCGLNRFAQIDCRLKQLFCTTKNLGGKSVLIVGDIKQLPPVFDTPLYYTDCNDIRHLGTSLIYQQFKYYELKTCMRQKNDIAFAKALSNFGEGIVRQKDIDLLNTRNFEDKMELIPTETIFLFHDNKSVDEYNSKLLALRQGESAISVALDTVKDENVGLQTRANNRNKKCKYIRNNWTPLTKHDTILNQDHFAGGSITRKQFPIAPSESATIYKSQGSTFGNICVKIEPRIKPETASLLYVGLSRTTSIKKLYINGKITAQHYQKNTKLLAELNRLRTTASLELPLYSGYKANCYTIYYHNTQTLNSIKQKAIVTDPLFRSLDCIILSEAKIRNERQIHLQPLNTLYYSDKNGTEKKPNILCLTKHYADKRLIVTKTTKVLNYGLMIDLLLLQINNVYILTGYASPKISKHELKIEIRKIAKCITPDCKLILIGDFNFDNLTPANSQFFSTLVPNYTLVSALPVNKITTIYNSQLDIVYTNIPELIANVYTSFYSDHYPIYVQLAFQ